MYFADELQKIILFYNPFKSEIKNVTSELQLELIELTSNDKYKEFFSRSDTKKMMIFPFTGIHYNIFIPRTSYIL